MRTITDHKVNGLNEAIEITAIGEPGSGGANSRYYITLPRKQELMLRPLTPEDFEAAANEPPTPSLVGKSCTVLSFQEGPIATPADFNGITNEALLAVLIDRMRGFQGLIPSVLNNTPNPDQVPSYVMTKSPFACRENAIALTHLEEALMWLQKRTRDRMARGVEGSLKP
jgi:hypothetical protein